MRVEELIEKLKEMPSTADVEAVTADSIFFSIDAVEYEHGAVSLVSDDDLGSDDVGM